MPEKKLTRDKVRAVLSFLMGKPPIESLYSDGHFSSYQPIIDSFGTVALQVDEQDYQGDSFVLYHNPGGDYGLLVFGWGSCSGCDAMCACGSYADVDAVRNQLYNDVEWFDIAQDALDRLWDKAQKTKWSYHTKEWKKFRDKATTILVSNGARR